jgi:hypothetical protein
MSLCTASVILVDKSFRVFLIEHRNQGIFTYPSRQVEVKDLVTPDPIINVIEREFEITCGFKLPSLIRNKIFVYEHTVYIFAR